MATKKATKKTAAKKTAVKSTAKKTAITRRTGEATKVKDGPDFSKLGNHRTEYAGNSRSKWFGNPAKAGV